MAAAPELSCSNQVINGIVGWSVSAWRRSRTWRLTGSLFMANRSPRSAVHLCMKSFVFLQEANMADRHASHQASELAAGNVAVKTAAPPRPHRLGGLLRWADEAWGRRTDRAGHGGAVGPLAGDADGGGRERRRGAEHPHGRLQSDAAHARSGAGFDVGDGRRPRQPVA